MGWTVRLIPTFLFFILILITFNRQVDHILVVFRLYSALLPPSVACI
jgi:hypothetical protein